MAKVQKVLENMGFSPNEIKVYMTLNDHGSCKAGKISKLAKNKRYEQITEISLVSTGCYSCKSWACAGGSGSVRPGR